MPEETREVAIGQRLVSWRLRQGLSQASICRRTGFTPSYLSRLENGKVQPNLRTIRRIVSALRIDVAELLGPSPAEQKGEPCPRKFSKSRLCSMRRSSCLSKIVVHF